MDADVRLRAGRLAAQRLTPATACTSAEEAALAVIGVQAQDLRAAALALRSRVPGLTRSAVRAAPLLRTWTVRGTVHLIAASDRPWLHALFARRNARVFSQGRSDAAIRCTVPRTVHVRRSGAARTALRVRPGTRERNARAAARRS